jgi:hypothetical protein
VRRLGHEPVQPIAGAPDPTRLLEATTELAADVGEATERARMLRDAGREPQAQAARETLPVLSSLEERRVRLAQRLRAAIAVAGPASKGSGALVERVAQDRELAASLRARAASLGERLDARLGSLLGDALAELHGRLDDMLRRTQLARIDAVVGEKRRIEREIQDLAAGKFPASLADRLSIEGLIGDDEEYWPPEKERWLDEYEGYR